MGRFLAVLIGLACAAAASQAPAFTLQYMQNLQGRLDELKPLVAEFDVNMAEYGYTRDQAMVECMAATGFTEAACGPFVTAIKRYERLSAHMAELEAVGDYARPLILAKTQMRDITKSVYKQFEPAIPATAHGAVYAAGGFGAGWGLSSFVFGLLGAMAGGGRRYA